MGIYNSAVITSTGQALLAQSVAGNDLKFTTVKTSNYTYPSGTSLADLTTLTGIKQSKNITGATVYNSRVIKVSAMVDNAGVTAEYSINTIGVYATVGTAAEQLFAVITAQEADKMPAFNSRPYSYIYDLNMTMQGTANITVTVNNAGFVNINDLNNALEGINANIEALETDKINVSDIVDSLESSATNKPLSANMGEQLNNNINELLAVKDFISNNITLAQYAIASLSFNIEYPGYTPIGVVGIFFDNTAILTVSRYAFNNEKTVLNVDIVNNWNGERTSKLTVSVLYKKNNSAT